MKKAQSELIGWVILLGFAVGLAVVVGGYIKNLASSSSENLVESTESDLACQDVFIIAKNTLNNNICETISGFVGSFLVENKGRRSIETVRISCAGKTGDVITNIRPGANKEINSVSGLALNTCNSITIIPFIQGNVGCSDKRLRIDCENV